MPAVWLLEGGHRERNSAAIARKLAMGSCKGCSRPGVVWQVAASFAVEDMLPSPRIAWAGGERVQIGEGVHRLTPGVCNFYLIEDGGKLVLVDAGAPRDWDLLVRTLPALGHRLEDLDAVLITHAHSDHTGFAERARNTVGTPVWIHQADAAVAKGAKPAKNDGKARSYLLRVEFYRTLISLTRRGATKLIPIQEVSTFADGETLAVPGRPRAVHAPGHTPGSSALLLEGRRVLLTGDVLATRNPLTGRVGPQIMPSGLNRDTPQALRSLDVLDGIPADVLLPGHGEPWTDGAAEAARLARLAGPS
jgi:glyoxylase-like metal-dependent hydrolase (beta-lactamase superfamily II)